MVDRTPITQIEENLLVSESDTITLPTKYEEKIKALVDEMENELGVFLTIDVQQNGKHSSVFYPLEERKRTYQVTMKDSKYTTLDGIYSSLSSIKEKLFSLAVEDMMSKKTIPKPEKRPLPNNRNVWKCPVCNSYGVSAHKDQTIKRFNMYPPDSMVIRCYNCNYEPKFPNSDWFSLEIRPISGEIGILDKDSQFVELGKLEVIR